MKPAIARHSRWFSVLLICFIVSIPLNNCYEIAAMMRGTLQSNTESLTPVYLKLFKDIFFVLSVVLFIASCMKSLRGVKTFTARPFVLLNIFVGLIALTSLYSFSFMPADIVLMGIRGYWSIGFVYVGAMYYNFSERKVYSYIVAIFLLHFALQMAQFITNAGSAIYSGMRSPGLFVIPSTAGAFALLVHYFSIRLKSQALRVLSTISLVLSNSTTGLLILILFYVYTFRNKLKPKILFYPVYSVVIAAVGFEVISHLGEITGRGSGASVSALTRLGILYLALTNWRSLVFGIGMGVATSQATISGYSNAFIADNTYVGILYNAGVVPSLLMLLFIFQCFRYFENKLPFFVLLGYSMTSVIFEMNPVVQLILILLGARIGQVRSIGVRSGAAIEGMARPADIRQPSGGNELSPSIVRNMSYLAFGRESPCVQSLRKKQ